MVHAKPPRFHTTWFEDFRVVVFHPSRTRIYRADLVERDIFFVWGQLMDPEFIQGLTGSYIPFSPAILSGYQRKCVKRGGGLDFRLKKASGGVTQGTALLRMGKKDIEILDKFEEVPRVMVRKKIKVMLGDLKREAYIYLKAK